METMLSEIKLAELIQLETQLEIALVALGMSRARKNYIIKQEEILDKNCSDYDDVDLQKRVWIAKKNAIAVEDGYRHQRIGIECKLFDAVRRVVSLNNLSVDKANPILYRFIALERAERAELEIEQKYWDKNKVRPEGMFEEALSSVARKEKAVNKLLSKTVKLAQKAEHRNIVATLDAGVQVMQMYINPEKYNFTNNILKPQEVSTENAKQANPVK